MERGIGLCLLVFCLSCSSKVAVTPAHVETAVGVGESFGVAREGHEPVEFPPFIRVIARPELYHSKRIQLVGYMNLEFEGNALYLSEEQYLQGGPADALWIDVEAMKGKPPFARGWVVVEGTFNGERRGHFGMFAGTLEAITRLQAWSAKPGS